MKEEVKQIAEAVATHPKTSLLIVALTNISTWWVEWVDPVVDAGTSLLGLILVCVLIRYHWQNTKKLKRELDNE